MAKDNLEYIKGSLSTQEQILTQAIAGERFARKHKGKIIAIVVIGILAIIYFSVAHLIEQKAHNRVVSSSIPLVDKKNTLFKRVFFFNLKIFINYKKKERESSG